MGIASNMHHSPLPRSWKGKDFAPNNQDSFSKLWLCQFWREVSIWDDQSLRLFGPWPLIPLTTGELVSCANARFIMSFFPGGGGKNLGKNLEKKKKKKKKK